MRRRHRSAEARSPSPGGSAPPLDSPAPQKGKRRTWTEQDYARYLASPSWAAKRRAVLERDVHCQAQGCIETSRLQVHHRKYPRVLGEEPLQWLAALCEQHHQALHRMTQKHGVGLKTANKVVLGEIPTERMEIREGRPYRVVRLPDGEEPSRQTWGRKRRGKRLVKKVRIRRGHKK